MTDNQSLMELAEYKNIKKEVSGLRVKRSDLVLNRDQDCKNIESRHLTFDALEFKMYDAYCTYRQLKYKTEMIRFRENREGVGN